jgi:hypothetical protein
MKDEKRRRSISSSFILSPSSFDKLARMDSNHDKQNQNLLCYRYTTGQYGGQNNARQQRIVGRSD